MGAVLVLLGLLIAGVLANSIQSPSFLKKKDKSEEKATQESIPPSENKKKDSFYELDFWDMFPRPEFPDRVEPYNPPFLPPVPKEENPWDNSEWDPWVDLRPPQKT